MRTLHVVNVHERSLPAAPDDVGNLLDRLASPTDALWPRDRWPAMRIDRPLGVGARGGHGPIRYVVEEYRPGELVRFRFTAPSGFDGFHVFSVHAENGGTTLLRHELAMRPTGMARLSWSLVFRPLHDALLEDALDRASQSVGDATAYTRWSVQVRLLRWLFRRRNRQRTAAD